MYQCFETYKVSHRNTCRHTMESFARIYVSTAVQPGRIIANLCMQRLGSLMDSRRIQIYTLGLHIVHLYKQHINLCSSEEEYPIFQGFSLRQQLFSLRDKRNFVKMKAFMRYLKFSSKNKENYFIASSGRSIFISTRDY